MNRPVLKKIIEASSATSVKLGLMFAGVAIYLPIVGVLQAFDKRALIVDVLSFGRAIMLLLGFAVGISVAHKLREKRFSDIAFNALLAGLIAVAAPSLLLLLMQQVNLRRIFINLSPQFAKFLSFGLELKYAVLALILGSIVLAVTGAAFFRLSSATKRPIIVALSVVSLLAAFQELIQLVLGANPVFEVLRQQIYTWDGLTLSGALSVAILSAGITVIVARIRAEKPQALRAGESDNGQRSRFKLAACIAAIAVCPLIAGPYISQVFLLVCLYCLMGMGQNIEVGLAGLLDLGFVAFFAVGAYTTALLTADSSVAFAAHGWLPSLNYWMAMPIAVVASVCVGVAFGIPVLRVKGDYLAIGTLALGEIVRVLVQSDFAAPLLGGSKGILHIPRPSIGSYELNGPVSLFYVTFACTCLAAYCAWRLENSRLGRAWMAMRDDEDVAQALGINLVQVKLLAYGLGAAFAGLAGSIFAVMLTQVYPSSFQLQLSINVLVLVVIGGTGSLPGVILGAAVLVGLPELLREFAEYRFLFYGALLIIVMRFRPQGLWPRESRRQRVQQPASGNGITACAALVENAVEFVRPSLEVSR